MRVCLDRRDKNRTAGRARVFRAGPRQQCTAVTPSPSSDIDAFILSVACVWVYPLPVMLRTHKNRFFFLKIESELHGIHQHGATAFLWCFEIMCMGGAGHDMAYSHSV